MQYEFKDFKWLATGDGFNYPVDVYYNNMFLGTLIAEPRGFAIKLIDTPHGKQLIKQSKTNIFKSLNLAAQVLHRTWKIYRQPEPPQSLGGDLIPA
jgi:hypothetical protein